MLRYLTAGESHGQALVATLDGVPAHLRLTSADIAAELRRRRLGYGRGARMKFEQDAVTILGGVRHGETIGSPIALSIQNSEWDKWSHAMSPDPVPETVTEPARDEPLLRPRPGHADLAGISKFDFAEARPVLERASARETAARVALGAVAKQLLAQIGGITVLSHVVQLGPIRAPETELPRSAELPLIDASPVRCLDGPTTSAMIAELDAAKAAGDTVGGVIEVVAWGLCPGLGSYTQADRRLDARLAGALMGIPAIKAVSIGAGDQMGALRGSAAHDELTPAGGGIQRVSNRAGGIEGGISNGSPIWVRCVMKPIPTLAHSLRTVDISTHTAAAAHHQRSDVCAVPAAGVVAESVLALVLADALLDKFGGDAVAETKRNYLAYLTQLRERGLEIE